MQIETFFEQQKIAVAGKTLVVATSGGPDSIALLDLLRNYRKHHDFELVVAHFDHQLRPDSGDEVRLLEAYCQQYNLPLINGKWPVSLHPKVGIEAAARQARYDFLTKVAKKVGASYLLTAHHNDDLLENILLKLLRSGNPEEMNSLQMVGEMQGVKILRPLLSYTKDQLLAYDHQAGLSYIEDQTNAEDDTLRNRLRHHVVPILKQEQADLTENTLRFNQQMELLTSLAQRQMAQIAPAERFLQTAYRAPVSALDKMTALERNYYWQQQLWRQQHLRLGTALKGYLLKDYQGYEYLLPGKLPPASTPKLLELEQAIRFRGQDFIVSEKRLSLPQLGQFYSTEAKFKFGSLPRGTKLLLKDGHHAKAKKMFAQNAIPLELRHLCLTIMTLDGTVVFVEQVYQNQQIAENARKYYIYSKSL